MTKKLPFIIRFFKHLNTILTHKYWVFYYCCKLGIPIQGITHDLSKFSPVEFFEGVKYYTENQSPIWAAKKDKGYSEAWFHHRSKNKHHYEHWMDNFDNGGENILMPCKYALELIADYLAAAQAYVKFPFVFSYENELIWWQNRLKKPIAMHPALQAFITDCLTEMARTSNMISKQKAIQYYNQETYQYRKEVSHT